MRKEWILDIGYRGSLYRKNGREMDRLIEKKLHKRSSGGGMGCWKGATRDLSFWYRSERDALKALPIAKRIKGVVRAKVEGPY